MFGILMLLSILLIADSLLRVAAEPCTRFSTNGSAAATYNFHRFYDFRNLAECFIGDAEKLPGSGNDCSPSVTSNGQSKIIAGSPWSADWDARYWLKPAVKNGTIDMRYSPSSVSISRDKDGSIEHNTYLSLHTMRLENGTQLASQLESNEYNVTYASIRMSGRIRGASGAVAGFFTYHNDTAESDIEIPTGSTRNEMHCSNQPTTDPETAVPIHGSTFNVSTGDEQPTSGWNDYRLDWVQDRSVWYVNGKQSAETTVNVPDAESTIILNVWSNGGNFSGRMNFNEEAWFDIQWVELLFNISTTTVAKGGGTVCSVESSPGSLVPNGSCMASGEYSDLTITCGNDVYKTHKMIVCTQSEFFAAALRFGGKESEESKIDLPHDEPIIVKLLVQYLYTGNYSVTKYGYKFPHTCSENCSDNENLSADEILVHAKMYEMADKYNIVGLKGLSRSKFRTGCSLHWNEDSFPVAANHAFSTTIEEDKGLRDVVSDTIATHMELIRKPEIEALMTAFGGLSYRILLRKAETVVVCEQVDFFARAIKFGGKESAEGRIDLPVEEAAAIKLLIQYLYEGDYEPQLPDKRCGLLVDLQRPKFGSYGHAYSYDFPHTCPVPNSVEHQVCKHHTCQNFISGYERKDFVCETCGPRVTGDSSQLLLHIKMYEIADKYQATGLKDLAAEKFHRACGHFWNETDFATAALYVCDSTPGRYEGLYDTVVKAMFEHIDVLIKKLEIEDVLRKFAGLGFSVLKLKTEADQQK
ncbi:glycoside hydrolase family 16 protein [Curvularia clavata]|uniref:Glycoside hydrolase family 16 protein n=1 Tax=Curvularia clavata TaxID=95742 RepID=A0A9Q8Z2U5_CURCL|nr:glycoside hydrolase family 16 protein [Curvularia clavata]